MGAESDKKQRDTSRDRQLFGTLLASKPARARSPLALGVSIAVHIVLLGLLVLVSRPFVPQLAQKLFEQISIITPVEEPQVTLTTVPVKPLPQPPHAAPRKTQTQPPAGGQALTYRPGPITAIPAPSQGPPTQELPDNGVGGNGKPTLTDRLRPSVLDPRLSPGGLLVRPDLTPAEAVNIRIAQTLQQYNDSVSAEAEARRKGLDWTIKTKDGKQWGVGPDGKIHLGDITLPALFAFQNPAGRRDEINARNRAFAEIEQQANREIERQTFKDRVKAIRARKDKEREEKKKSGNDAPPITN